MRKNLAIEKSSLEGFTAKTRIFADYGKGVNKYIDLVVDPLNSRMWFEYSDHKNIVYKGPSLEEAIHLFNK